MAGRLDVLIAAIVKIEEPLLGWKKECIDSVCLLLQYLLQSCSRGDSHNKGRNGPHNSDDDAFDLFLQKQKRVPVVIILYWTVCT